MITQNIIFSLLLIYFSINYIVLCAEEDQCSKLSSNEQVLMKLSKDIVPALEGLKKGEAGKIAVIGGATEYTGAPYFAAISALKVGADLVHVITTEPAAPVIKSYSPDLIVYPFLATPHLDKIKKLMEKIDVVIIGPGLGREDETMLLTFEILKTCKDLSKPLVIDADGLYAVHKNISILYNYPRPGVILTPNFVEAKRLKDSIPTNDDGKWYDHWGENVSVLIKGKSDEYHSVSNSSKQYDWSLSEGGSGRRAGGQGDILAGALGTLYNWAIKSKVCGTEKDLYFVKSVAAYAAAKLTRTCNFNAFSKFKRGMAASDMLHEISSAFTELFEKV